LSDRIVVVQQGDCAFSIAEEHGHCWETVWNHPDNAELRELRGDPAQLQAGDRIVVPVLTPRQESAPTGHRHRYRRNSEPAILRLQLHEQDLEGAAPPAHPAAACNESDTVELEDGGPPPPLEEKPRADQPYALEIDGVWQEGRTSSEGEIELRVPPRARSGRVILEPGTEREQVLPLHFGRLDPANEASGARQRLHHLGYATDCDELAFTPALEALLAQFQEEHELEVSGTLDPTTVQKLVEVHGS
jgi:N-acetylmuramoyl-L-alanine amidase